MVNIPKPTLLIFDIDGTLTYGSGLGRVAFERAAEEIYGISNATKGIKPHGRTDPDIFLELLNLNNIPAEDFRVQFDRFMDSYVEHLHIALNNGHPMRILEGVTELLEVLSIEPNVHLALGTGNIKRGAYAKLEYLNIAQYFPVGGFGDNAHDRTELLTEAIQNSCEYYHKAFESIWVIGDTPADIGAGQKLNTLTIGVATGGHSYEILMGCCPTHTLRNFQDRTAFLNVIANGTKG